jgi:hypothetical protein
MEQSSAGGPAHRTAPAGVTLRYASSEAARRDRMGDVDYGLLARTAVPLQLGDRPEVTIELAEERVTVRVPGEVRWLTPLVNGVLAGLVLSPRTHRDEVQLDLLFARRNAGTFREPALTVPAMPAMPALTPAPGRTAIPAHTPVPGRLPAIAAPALTPRPFPALTPLPGITAAVAPAGPREISVAMLQPNPVLREMLSQALARFAREKGGWTLSIEAVGETEPFLEALAAHRRTLAIIDCDPVGAAVEGLVASIRSHHGWERLPLILLSSVGVARFDDARSVFVKKPIAIKSFVDLASVLVGA